MKRLRNYWSDVVNRVSIFGVNIFNVDFREAMEIVENFLKGDGCKKIFTPNTEIVMEAKEHSYLRDLVNLADLVIPDGIGLIYASKLRGKPLKERVTGYDVSMELLKIANRDNLRLYLLGGKPGVSQKAAENIEKKYPNIDIVGNHHGYFKGVHLGEENSQEEREIIEEINRLKPHIIFLGLGFPKQEVWINEYSNILESKVIIGNGGVIDILAENAKRAPDIFIKLNLEWFYRLISDPSRIKRQIAIPKFIFSVLTDRDSVK